MREEEDYAGPTVEVADRRTGEVHEAKVFVGVLAAANHTFVDVTLTRSLPDWTASDVRMFDEVDAPLRRPSTFGW